MPVLLISHFLRQPWLLVGFCSLLAAPLQPAFAQNTALLDDLNGFAGLQLGDSLPSFTGLVPQGSFQRKQRYRVAEPAASFQDVQFAFVDALFYKGRLHSIYLRVNNEANGAFLRVLEDFFGPGSQDGLAPRYRWKGKRVRLKYDRNLISGNADVWFVSLEQDARFRKEYVVVGED